MKPTIKPSYGTTLHKDGTVSYWNVFTQQWERTHAGNIPDDVIASLPTADRPRIAKLAAK